MIVATLALLFQVRGGSAMLGAGGTCTSQLAQMMSAEEAPTLSPCCSVRHESGKEMERSHDAPRDCCDGGAMPAHCCLTVVPAIQRVELAIDHSVHITTVLSHRDGTLSMPQVPLLRPPILC